MLRHRPPLTILLLLYPLLAAASLLEKQFDGAQSGLRRSTLDPSPNVSVCSTVCVIRLTSVCLLD